MGQTVAQLRQFMLLLWRNAQGAQTAQREAGMIQAKQAPLAIHLRVRQGCGQYIEYMDVQPSSGPQG